MHLVDGIKINKIKDNKVEVCDGEGKPIFISDCVNTQLLEEMIWLYKRKVENFKGEYSEMFTK